MICVGRDFRKSSAQALSSSQCDTYVTLNNFVRAMVCRAWGRRGRGEGQPLAVCSVSLANIELQSVAEKHTHMSN